MQNVNHSIIPIIIFADINFYIIMKYSTNLAENRKPKVDGNFQSESNSVDGDELSAKEYEEWK